MTDKDSPQADQPELTAVNQGNATQAAGESKTGTAGGYHAQPGAVA